MEKISQASYIIESSKGYFKPFIGSVHEQEGDNDSTLFVLASGPKSTLEEAQEFLKNNNPENTKMFLAPVKSNESLITWLSELVEAEKERLYKEKETLLDKYGIFGGGAEVNNLHREINLQLESLGVDPNS